MIFSRKLYPTEYSSFVLYFIYWRVWSLACSSNSSYATFIVNMVNIHAVAIIIYSVVLYFQLIGMIYDEVRCLKTLRVLYMHMFLFIFYVCFILLPKMWCFCPFLGNSLIPWSRGTELSFDWATLTESCKTNTDLE